MADEFGRWIEHDGYTPLLRGLPNSQIRIEVIWVGHGVAPPDLINPNWPGFYWRWKRVRVGWFRSKLRRVCDVADYAPIIRYRVRYYRALQQLRDLAEGLPADASIDA